MTNIIGITGLAGHGKTSVAKIIQDKYDYQEYALASPIKRTINAMFGWDERHSDGVLKEQELYTQIISTGALPVQLWQCFPDDDIDYHMMADFDNVFRPYRCYEVFSHVQYYISPRKAYQLFGTEFGRNCIDPDVWLDMIPKGNVVVSDVRFDNEAEYITQRGGRIIRVVSDRPTTKNNGHISEKGIDLSYISATIENTGTMEQLMEKVERVWQLMI